MCRDLRNVNPILRRFISHVISIRSGPSETLIDRELLKAVCNVTDEVINVAFQFSNTFNNHLKTKYFEFSQSYGTRHFELLDEGRADACRTKCIFPGLRQYRPAITFDGLESRNCSKIYNKFEFHRPGLLTTQCVCTHPKLRSFRSLLQPESTAFASCVCITHDRIPLAVIVYDNSCTVWSSIVMRMPWLLHISKIVVDKFHYPSHICTSLYDSQCFPAMRSFPTSGAESVNVRIARFINFSQYLTGDNLVRFMTASFSFHNFSVELLWKYESTNLGDRDYRADFRALSGCSCEGCASLDDIDILIRDVLELCTLTAQHYQNQFTVGTDGSSDGDGFSVGTDVDEIVEESDDGQTVGTSRLMYSGDTASGGYESSSNLLSETFVCGEEWNQIDEDCWAIALSTVRFRNISFRFEGGVYHKQLIRKVTMKVHG